MCKKLIKLTSSNKLDNVSFYFNTLEECEEFKYVFKDHWCHVEWEKPEEVDAGSVPHNKLRCINDHPKLRAERNLSWGFNSAFTDKSYKGLTSEEEAFVSMMVSRVTGGN